MNAALFTDSAPQIEESEGLFHLTVTSGQLSTTYVMTLHNLSRHVRACNRALDGFHERQTGAVVALKR